MALANEEINAEAERRRKEEERRKKQAPRGQTVAVPRGEVGSFSKAYQGYKFVEEGSPESRSAMNIGEFTEKEAQRRFEEKRGKDWVGQMEARVKEGEPQRAREALATVAARNRAMRQEPLPSPLQEDRTLQEINLPGGGRVKFGNKTLAQMREFEAKEKERVGKEQARVAAAKENIYANRYAAATQRYGREMDPKKRYAAELAERGLRNPLEATTPQERRQIEEENAKEQMADFRTAISAKERAARAEAQIVRDYKDYKNTAREARNAGNAQVAVYYERLATDLNERVGGNINNVTARRRVLEQDEMDSVQRELRARANFRKEVNAKRTTANPESSTFVPQSTAAPIGVGTEDLRYGQPPTRGDAFSQPFGLVPPRTQDRGVDFGALSEANISGQQPISGPSIPPPTPTAQKVKTSKEITSEDVAPGISQITTPQRMEGEPPSDYNKRVIEEYDRQVIVPSFDEQTQSALLSAREINQELDSLYNVRFSSKENRDRYNQLKQEAKDKRSVIKNKIKELRSERRKVAFSDERRATFYDQQIATLQNELGPIEKLLF
jgi:hypothetical protein